MNSKIKTTLLTGFLFFIMMSSVQAQDKYNYSQITFNKNSLPPITISYTLKPFEKIEIEKSVLKNLDYRDVSPALKQISDMKNEGWELFDFEAIPVVGGITYIYHLRKKQQ